MIEDIKQDFKSKVCEQVDLQPEGRNRFIVTTPFRFDDGDHFGIFLKREGDKWILTDEASTLQHLSYELPEDSLKVGTRADIINASLAGFSVENDDGELRVTVGEEGFGNALFSFIQALTKVNDTTFLSRERVKSTFMEDLRNFLKQEIAPERIHFNWTFSEYDQAKKYPADVFVNGMRRPLVIYGLTSEEKVSLATISLHMYEKWSIRFQSLGIFESQESLPGVVVARFSDICEKTFSNLEGNKPRISNFLEQKLHPKD